MSHYIYRVTLVGLNAAGVATTFRYATRGYTTSPAAGSLPNTHFEGLVKQPLLFRRDMYGEGHTYGSAEIPHGTCILSNSGLLDGLLDYGFDGQLFELHRIDPASPDTALLEFRGTVEQLTMSEDEVVVLVRDPTYVFDQALQPTKYAGNNSLPNGLEGVEGDIKGTPKPLIYGYAFNVEPPCVNTARLIYQVHDGASGTFSFDSVYDKGEALSVGISRSLADFQAGETSKTVSAVNTASNLLEFAAAHGFSTGTPVHVNSSTTLPGGVQNTLYYYAQAVSSTLISLHNSAADATGNIDAVDITSAGSGTITVATNRTPPGWYDRCIDTTAGCFFRLGLIPQGQVTADVSNASMGGPNFWYPEMIAHALVNRAGTYTVDTRYAIGSPSTQLGSGWFRQEITIYEALRQALSARNASFQIYPNRQSGAYLTLQRLELPAGTAVVELGTYNVKALSRVQPSDATRGIPAWRTNIGYLRRYVVQKGADLAASVSEARKAALAQEYLTVVVEDSAVKNRFPLAPELNFQTSLMLSTPATGFGTDYVKNVYFKLADTLRVTVPKEVFDDVVTSTPANPEVPGPMLGMTIKLVYPRFGCNNGRMFVILGYQLDYAAREVELILWGPRS